MIPFVNMIFIVVSIAKLIFYQRSIKYITYSNYFEYYKEWNCLMFYHSMFFILISIAFSSNNVIFVLFMWIISIPFKLAPVRYIANVISNGFSI